MMPGSYPKRFQFSWSRVWQQDFLKAAYGTTFITVKASLLSFKVIDFLRDVASICVQSV